MRIARLANRVQVGQRDRVLPRFMNTAGDVAAALAQQRLRCLDVHPALERVVGLQVAALRDDESTAFALVVDGARSAARAPPVIRRDSTES